MSTGRDIVRGALRKIGAIAAGEAPTGDELNDGMLVLNEMVESWSTERLLIYTITEETFSLVVSQGAYTIGPGGDFDTVRPLKIIKANLKDTLSGTTFETYIKIQTMKQWANIALKDTKSSYPTKLYCDMNFPLATINFWPVPTAAHSIVLFSQKSLASFTSAGVYTLPPGYTKALIFNLAIDIAPEYGKEPSGSVVANAMESKGNIKRINSKPGLLGMDSAVLDDDGSFNLLTGENG